MILILATPAQSKSETVSPTALRPCKLQKALDDNNTVYQKA